MAVKQQSKVAKLRAQIAKLKKERRSERTIYSHLYNRTWELAEYLEDHIIPELNTTRKQRCQQLVDRVNNLL